MRRNSDRVSCDVNKMHMAEGGVPDLVLPQRPVEKCLFLRQNDEDLSSFFYQMISMNHHITKTAKEVLWDFLTGIAPLKYHVADRRHWQGSILLLTLNCQLTLAVLTHTHIVPAFSLVFVRKKLPMLLPVIYFLYIILLEFLYSTSPIQKMVE